MSDNVRRIRPVDSGGEPPDMDQRLRQLEQDVAVIKETMATREDLHKTISSQTWKFISALGIFMTVMTGLFAAIVSLL